MKWSVDEAKSVGGVKSMEMKKINRKYWLMPVIIFSLMLLWHFNCYATRACLKNHSRNLYAPLCGIFCPNSVAVARYGAFMRTKSPTNCDAHLAEGLFQTCSRQIENRENIRNEEPEWT